MVKKEGMVYELFNKDTIFFWISMIVATAFTYGYFFVATTELQKVHYNITAMLWIILGLVINKRSCPLTEETSRNR